MTVGTGFGWKRMDCIFLGGMIAMSSTTIIYKAFDDLGTVSYTHLGNLIPILGGEGAVIFKSVTSGTATFGTVSYTHLTFCSVAAKQLQ